MQEETLDEAIKALEKNIIIVTEQERWEDEFKDPTAYFIINASGEAIFFKTRDRLKAQEFSDRLYGKGFYLVRKSIKAKLR